MAQPRNIIIGMALSSIIGMAIAKLFALQTSAFPNYTHDWAAAATTVAISLMVTQVFNIP
jgi:CBS-domain-containing membrane protein